MGGFSLNLNTESIHGSVVEARFQPDDPNRKIWGAVKAENRGDTFDGSVFHETFRSTASLFRRLEKQPNFTAELISVILQDPGCGKQTCCVGIVTAGMHNTLIFRCV